jgi:hypothetical protein
MREQDLAGVEAAGVLAPRVGAGAEEGDLEAQLVLQPAGHIPPLDAKFRVRAMVAWKREPAAWSDLRVVDLGRMRLR